MRQEALLALSRLKPSAHTLASVEELIDDADSNIRLAACSCLNIVAPERTDSLLDKMAGDAPAFQRLATNRQTDAVLDALRKASGNIHTQGISLASLVKRTDTEGIRTLLRNTELPFATRLGLIEGLGAIAGEPAQKALLEFAGPESKNERLQKAAWTALRRAKRKREKPARKEAGQ